MCSETERTEVRALLTSEQVFMYGFSSQLIQNLYYS